MVSHPYLFLFIVAMCLSGDTAIPTFNDERPNYVWPHTCLCLCEKYRLLCIIYIPGL